MGVKPSTERWAPPNDQPVKLVPKCALGRTEPYVSKTGQYLPCCFLAGQEDQILLRRLLGDDMNLLDLNQYTPEQIRSSRAFEKIAATWDTAAFWPCRRVCAERPEHVPDNGIPEMDHQFAPKR